MRCFVGQLGHCLAKLIMKLLKVSACNFIGWCIVTNHISNTLYSNLHWSHRQTGRHFKQFCDIIQCFENDYILHSSCFNFICYNHLYAYIFIILYSCCDSFNFL